MRNSWQKIKLVCGNHGQDYTHELRISEGKAGMSSFYSCPCFIRAGAKVGIGASCNNRLSINDFEKALKKVTNNLIDENGLEKDLLGFTFKIDGVEYEVLDSETPVRLSVKNLKAIGK